MTERTVAGMPWPAMCADCGFTTEDPDAYGGDDEELAPEGVLCTRTGTFHRWRGPVDVAPRPARPLLPWCHPVERDLMRRCRTHADRGIALCADEMAEARRGYVPASLSPEWHAELATSFEEGRAAERARCRLRRVVEHVIESNALDSDSLLWLDRECRAALLAPLEDDHE